MDAIEKDLSEAEAKAFYIFLESERRRHIEDVEFIASRLNRLELKYGFTRQDCWKMRIAADEFVRW